MRPSRVQIVPVFHTGDAVFARMARTPAVDVTAPHQCSRGIGVKRRGPRNGPTQPFTWIVCRRVLEASVWVQFTD